MKQPQKVVVALSGGVDSSVAAALLVEQGYEVIGMMMRLWNEPGRETFNHCCTPEAMARARTVAAKLEIPFYAIDAQDIFHEVVVNYFIDGYTSGITPNPCLKCNRYIRWKYLLDHAIAIGADYMATGHYARLQTDSSESIKLLKAVDDDKDQSYVLSVLGQEQLQHALFPLGDYTKKQVRQMAREFGLPVAETKDSQDLCFLAGTEYASFLRRNAPEAINPGPIVGNNGDILGQHHGLAFYTLGQRKGLGISASRPQYVLEKDTVSNTLVVGIRDELGNIELTTGIATWVSGSSPHSAFPAKVKIRYTSNQFPAFVTPAKDGSIHISFDFPIYGITPGQAAVVYLDDEVLGYGIIKTNQENHSKPPKELISADNIQ